MFEELMKDLQGVGEVEQEVETPDPMFGESGNPVKEFSDLWETAANHFSDTSKSLDELSAKMDQSRRQTVPEITRKLQLLMFEATVLIRTMHKQLEKDEQCNESEKTKP